MLARAALDRVSGNSSFALASSAAPDVNHSSKVSSFPRSSCEHERQRARKEGGDQRHCDHTTTSISPGRPSSPWSFNEQGQPVGRSSLYVVPEASRVRHTSRVSGQIELRFCDQKHRVGASWDTACLPNKFFGFASRRRRAAHDVVRNIRGCVVLPRKRN